MCGEEERKKITHTLDSGMNHHRLLEGCINASMSNGRRCNAKEREEVAKEKETIKTRGMKSERKAKKREQEKWREQGWEQLEGDEDRNGGRQQDECEKSEREAIARATVDGQRRQFDGRRLRPRGALFLVAMADPPPQTTAKSR